MRDEALLEIARKIAEHAHAGQVDKAGKPYIAHPLRVSASLTTVDAKIVGMLHDVVEDSPFTLDDLRARGFSEAVVEAVAALTKREGEDKERYYQRVMANRLALEVKIADMTDNLDPTRIENPTDADRARNARYREVLPRLQAALADT